MEQSWASATEGQNSDHKDHADHQSGVSTTSVFNYFLFLFLFFISWAASVRISCIGPLGQPSTLSHHVSDVVGVETKSVVPSFEVVLWPYGDICTLRMTNFSRYVVKCWIFFDVLFWAKKVWTWHLCIVVLAVIYLLVIMVQYRCFTNAGSDEMEKRIYFSTDVLTLIWGTEVSAYFNSLSLVVSAPSQKSSYQTE